MVGGVVDFILIFVKPVQPLKHQAPKLVTELGIVIEVKPVQSWKQDCPKLATELGIVIEVKPVQPRKQELPKIVTELGIVIEVKPVQLTGSDTFLGWRDTAVTAVFLGLSWCT